jgi:hypothetical protein
MGGTVGSARGVTFIPDCAKSDPNESRKNNIVSGVLNGGARTKPFTDRIHRSIGLELRMSLGKAPGKKTAREFTRQKVENAS